MTVYDRFLNLSIRLIEKYTPNGTNVTWVQKGSPTVPDANKPWETEPAAEVTFDVRIIFLPDVLEDRQILKYLGKTEIGEGQVNGRMHPYDSFIPTINDVVRRPKEDAPGEYVELVVKAVDEYRPENQTIVYDLEFGL